MEPKKFTSKRVTDHLANERTLLAWIRTGIAIIGVGFVVARFGLLLRELGSKINQLFTIPLPISSLFGVSLTLVGAAIIVIALFNFISIRRSIDSENFHPPLMPLVVITVIITIMSVLIAIYLLVTT